MADQTDTKKMGIAGGAGFLAGAVAAAAVILSIGVPGSTGPELTATPTTQAPAATAAPTAQAADPTTEAAAPAEDPTTEAATTGSVASDGGGLEDTIDQAVEAVTVDLSPQQPGETVYATVYDPGFGASTLDVYRVDEARTTIAFTSYNCLGATDSAASVRLGPLSEDEAWMADPAYGYTAFDGTVYSARWIGATPDYSDTVLEISDEILAPIDLTGMADQQVAVTDTEMVTQQFQSDCADTAGTLADFIVG